MRIKPFQNGHNLLSIINFIFYVVENVSCYLSSFKIIII